MPIELTVPFSDLTDSAEDNFIKNADANQDQQVTETEFLTSAKETLIDNPGETGAVFAARNRFYDLAEITIDMLPGLQSLPTTESRIIGTFISNNIQNHEFIVAEDGSRLGLRITDGTYTVDFVHTIINDITDETAFVISINGHIIGDIRTNTEEISEDTGRYGNLGQESLSKVHPELNAALNQIINILLPSAVEQ